MPKTLANVGWELRQTSRQKLPKFERLVGGNRQDCLPHFRLRCLDHRFKVAFEVGFVTVVRHGIPAHIVTKFPQRD
jgi:hypothetical protein